MDRELALRRRALPAKADAVRRRALGVLLRPDDDRGVGLADVELHVASLANPPVDEVVRGHNAQLLVRRQPGVCLVHLVLAKLAVAAEHEQSGTLGHLLQAPAFARVSPEVLPGDHLPLPDAANRQAVGRDLQAVDLRLFSVDVQDAAGVDRQHRRRLLGLLDQELPHAVHPHRVLGLRAKVDARPLGKIVGQPQGAHREEALRP
mmetsp:Transcript_113713/g.223022  ORF Transcript_113713/g.223022 Transcript_113713/m.223022 type:complete len:205 (-) Transcript_113713:53-667(-)